MGVCSLLCKLYLIIFNVLYTVMGFAFLGLGLWLKFGNNTKDLPLDAFIQGANALIGVGAVMLVVAVFGDYGGCNGKRWSLSVFAFLLAALIAAQIALYVQRENVASEFIIFYSTLYGIYTTSGDPIVGGTLTVLHHVLDCCGVLGLTVVSAACPERSGLGVFMSPCPVVIQDVFAAKPPLAMAIFYGNGVMMVMALVCAGLLFGLLRRGQPSVYQNVY